MWWHLSEPGASYDSEVYQCASLGVGLLPERREQAPQALPLLQRGVAAVAPVRTHHQAYRGLLH